jgi:hypothetical protein
MKLHPLRVLVLAFAVLVITSDRALADDYSIQLTNNTDLDPAQYSI